MPSYVLSKDAELDLRDIARYTLENWGQAQLNRYRQTLKNRFEAIGAGDVIGRKLSNELPNIYMSKAGAHFIFYLTPTDSRPIIIGVIHETRDSVKYLVSRLGED